MMPRPCGRNLVHSTHHRVQLHACQERVWDGLSVATLASSLLESARDDADLARLLACTAKESGAWLQALPISTLGLRLDDPALRIVVGLRLDVDPTGIPVTVHGIITARPPCSTDKQRNDILLDSNVHEQKP